MPRSNKQPSSKAKADHVISNKGGIKQKQRSSISTSSNISQMAKTMSRKQLIKSLAEIGILTPITMELGMLRQLYETNVNTKCDKHKNKKNLPTSSTRNKNEGHQAVNKTTGAINNAADDARSELDDDEDPVTNNNFDSETSGEEEQDDSAKFGYTAKKIKSKSGKPFTLFSAPVAEELLNLKTGSFGGRGDHDIEAVPKGLRKSIIEGFNVNLVRLLLPRDNKKYSRDDDDDYDKSIYLKSKADPRLDKNLTITEFILASSRYINIICEAFPQRRRELSAYMSDIIRLSSRFGHPFFYDYHRLFAQKAEALLHTRNILVDWSKRDHDIYLNVFSGLRPMVCDLCKSPDHTTSFCKKILERNDLIDKFLCNDSVKGLNANLAPVFPVRRIVGSDDPKSDSRPTCKFYNGAGFVSNYAMKPQLTATTPIDIDQSESELFNHPDKKFTSFLLSGLREGFDTGLTSFPEKSFECPNLRSARRDPVSVTCLINEELSKGFLIGPFPAPPFTNYRINPIGLVESKYSKKKRLIVDLSAPHNNSEHPSINSLIDKDSYTLSYVTVDDAIKRIQELGDGAWMNKVDIQDAFKLLPVKPSLWPFYGVK